jgi:hypothetical protein
MDLKGISKGSFFDFPWVRINNPGSHRVSQGLYFAKVNILKGEKILESSSAKIFVEK